VPLRPAHPLTAADIRDTLPGIGSRAARGDHSMRMKTLLAAAAE